jgi:metal-responsive CopG/Arc/MetJ family transcriptional regulator
MRQIITISLPKETKKEIDTLSAEEGISRSDLIRQSIKDYLFVHQFRALRRKMIPKAKAQGIHTDQDVFDRVS